MDIHNTGLHGDLSPRQKTDFGFWIILGIFVRRGQSFRPTSLQNSAVRSERLKKCRNGGDKEESEEQSFMIQKL
jgi:hypothetical protein